MTDDMPNIDPSGEVARAMEDYADACHAVQVAVQRTTFTMDTSPGAVREVQDGAGAELGEHHAAMLVPLDSGVVLYLPDAEAARRLARERLHIAVERAALRVAPALRRARRAAETNDRNRPGDTTGRHNERPPWHR